MKDYQKKKCIIEKNTDTMLNEHSINRKYVDIEEVDLAFDYELESYNVISKNDFIYTGNCIVDTVLQQKKRLYHQKLL